MSGRRGNTGAVLALALTLVLTSACEKHEFEPPDREEQVSAASARYSQAGFDTLTWASDSVRTEEGNGVYAASCRRCHGTVGRGDTDLARERGLEVPSLVEPEWAPASSLDVVRRRIFVGHEEGMPTFGIARMSPRDIDAVAFYILYSLRPEILGGEG